MERSGKRTKVGARMLWEVCRWRRQCRGDGGAMNNNLVPYYGADLAAEPGLKDVLTVHSCERDRSWAEGSAAIRTPDLSDLL